ncbi:arginine N-succinyltransferase [Shewanella sp. C32]|uniref:Arginine N-succinyltransferase n=1 Tax=Shewanella electrica TaxID=515560 RepID=A0ABT2FMB5_9GAMM|nr:arginine N-succinyltransferase [Shewanella electrica]MCH1925591.1 arginine N-succinyltransferase [Shewanella electrica]MCS4557102.1 arginine N-succinyltransferase [Shewanella electrica]
MLVIRPIRQSDFSALYTIAVESGHGFTSLPVNDELLAGKIARSVDSFAKTVEQPSNEGYLMVLEDTDTGEVVGTCGIEAAVGQTDAFYHYRLGTEVYYSGQIGVRNEVETLTLCHDYTGSAELCTLFLRQNYRKGLNGRLLSRVRFMLLAQFPERFGETVIAEMRGISDEHGNSPFYGWLQQHFLGIEFSQADYLSGLGQKAFMAEMMPRSTVYVCLLPEAAQRVIGEVHTNTRPALSMLQAEGFRWRNYIDIFDAGPTVECAREDIRSVKDSRLLTVNIVDAPADSCDTSFIVANTHLADFRATLAKLNITDDSTSVNISSELAEALLLKAGEPLRVIAI